MFSFLPTFPGMLCPLTSLARSASIFNLCEEQAVDLQSYFRLVVSFQFAAVLFQLLSLTSLILNHPIPQFHGA